MGKRQGLAPCNAGNTEHAQVTKPDPKRMSLASRVPDR